MQTSRSHWPRHISTLRLQLINEDDQSINQTSVPWPSITLHRQLSAHHNFNWYGVYNDQTSRSKWSDAFFVQNCASRLLRLQSPSYFSTKLHASDVDDLDAHHVYFRAYHSLLNGKKMKIRAPIHTATATYDSHWCKSITTILYNSSVRVCDPHVHLTSHTHNFIFHI